MVLLTGSCIGISLIGIFPTFAGIFIGRMLSGLSSNSQVCVRKLLMKICSKEKGDWASLSSKALWANRLGGMAALLASGLLSNPSVLLPDTSKFVTSRFFLLSLAIFLIDISGLLLAFSIDTSTIEEPDEAKYKELQEKKENVDQTAIEGKPEEPVKEKFDFRRFMDDDGVIKEESMEESFNAEEIKYYSPRHIANKTSYSKPYMSARPEPASGAQSAAETLEDNQQQSDVKKTHISFLEEDLEAMPKKKDEEKVPETPKNDSILRENLGILKLRAVLSGIASVVYESVPFVLVFEMGIEDSLMVSFILMIAYSAGAFFKLVVLDALCRFHTSFKIFFTSLGVLTLALLLFPLMAWFKAHVVLISITLSIIFICLESTIPISCILISDSISYRDREKALESNDQLSIAFKILTNFLSVLFIFHFGSLFTFSFIACSLIAVFFYVLKIKNMYESLNTSPYKI